MKVLIAPDKFKGSLTAQEVCLAIERGLKRFDPAIETMLHPLADGGEGTLEILDATLGLETIWLEVLDPLYRPVKAFYKMGRGTAYIEMAAASGLGLLSAGERNCLETTTFGTGELILDAIRRGVRKVILFIGGSATNDAGLGMAAALGYRFLDESGNDLKPIGRELILLYQIDTSNVKIDFTQVEFKVVCDVKNPLFGPDGAAWVYARQKGADESAIRLLDEGLVQFSKVVQSCLSKEISSMEGAGAAGGLGAGAVVFLNAHIRPGIETIMEVTGFQNKLGLADLVITGEGKLDEQTAAGKVIAGAAGAAMKANVPVVAICGTLEASPATLQSLGLYKVVAIKDENDSLETAVREAANRVEKAAFEMAQFFSKEGGVK